MQKLRLLAGCVLALASVAPITALGQSFGGAVATSGSDVFIGHTQNTGESGVVHVYRKNGGSWEETATLKASDADGHDDRFGRAMLFADGKLFVGATTRSNSIGGVYVFEKDAGSNAWGQKAMLVPDAHAEGDAFGRTLAMTSDQLLVGAAGSDSSRGAVFSYRRNANGSWTETAEIRPEGLEPNDLFGLNVAADGNVAIVSSFRQGNDRLPLVYAYRWVNGKWKNEGMLSSDAVTQQSVFGLSAAVSENRAFVGAQNHERQGAVFVFDYANGKWTSSGMLTSGHEEPTGFGASVTVHNGQLYVGAPGADDGAGKVYVFPLSAAPGSTPTDSIASQGSLDSFGMTLAFGDGIAVAGAPGADFGLGRAGIFSTNGDWKLDAELFTKTKSLAAVRGEQVRCEEGDAAGFGCQKVDLLSFMPVSELGGARGVRTNDIWGWTDPESGREYALVGRMDGTAFVDITDPYNPYLVGNLPMTEGSHANAWRDIKVYKDHAYIVADNAGQHGMQVFDLRKLRNVSSPPATFSETAIYDKIASAHNIVINEDTGFAYTVGNSSGGETCGGGSHMIDIRDPEHPKFAGCFAHEGTGRSGTGYTHDAQCVIYHGPDARYADREICFGANETALSIADVTDKDSTVALAAASYPNVGYAHQGWLTEDHRYFLLDDELDEINGLVDGTRTLIWDVSDLEDPQLVKEYMSDSKASDHNLYIKDNLVYQSNYVSGLRILDISDIMNPVQVGFFDTVPGESNDPGFDGSWSNYPFFKSGVIAVTSGAEGLFLVRKENIGL